MRSLALVNFFWCVVARKGLQVAQVHHPTLHLFSHWMVQPHRKVVTPTKARKANNAISRDTVRGARVDVPRERRASARELGCCYSITPGGRARRSECAMSAFRSLAGYRGRVSLLRTVRPPAMKSLYETRAGRRLYLSSSARRFRSRLSSLLRACLELSRARTRRGPFISRPRPRGGARAPSRPPPSRIAASSRRRVFPSRRPFWTTHRPHRRPPSRAGGDPRMTPAAQR